MAFPTRHWVRFSGSLAPGAGVILTHGLRNGQFANVAPDAVLFDMNDGFYLEPPNTCIGEYADRTTQYVYLSNFDGARGWHFYGVVCREYHSIDGANQ